MDTIWNILHEDDSEGLLGEILQKDDPRPAAEQIADRYAHGGGWSPMKGYIMPTDPTGAMMWQSADPGEDDEPEEYALRATSELDNGEKLFLYEADMLAIVQPDGTFEVTRMD